MPARVISFDNFCTYHFPFLALHVSYSSPHLFFVIVKKHTCLVFHKAFLRINA